MRIPAHKALAAVFAICLAALLAASPAVQRLEPRVRTESAGRNADDPAIWIHPTDPARNVVIGTNKDKAPDGSLTVYSLDGKVVQRVTGIDRPNNVDVEYRLKGPGYEIDIAVATERLQRRLRVFSIDRSSGRLTDVTEPGGTNVFSGEPGESAAPMGIGLYRRPADGAVFAIVSRKTGPRDGYLWQYELTGGATGRVSAKLVRKFGRYSGSKEIEAVAVDDAAGYAYYSDEGDGVHKYHADPAHPQAARELAHFALSGYRGDREGIALYAKPDGTGYLIVTDQLPGESE